MSHSSAFVILSHYMKFPFSIIKPSTIAIDTFLSHVLTKIELIKMKEELYYLLCVLHVCVSVRDVSAEVFGCGEGGIKR